MKTKLTMMVAAAMACAAIQLAAMPTEDESKRAEPAVQKLLEPERAALKSGKKTYSEVAVAAMKLVGEVDTDAEKLLLMKGAFVLYVLDGNFEKSVETMKALKAAIPDIPPQSVTNLIETALLGVAKKEDGARLYKLLDESNVDIASVVVEERNQIVPETATEKTRKAIAKLFPGWSLDTEVCDDNAAGIQPIIRGKRNVTCVHPKKGPSVISRTVKLSGNNPCLSLCVASWNDDADILLSVRVNGKEVLTNRVVGTTDAAPWEDIVVPLSAWRGSTAKIEVGFANYGRRWYEIPCLARVDIIEADGDMSIHEGKCEVNGYTWSYRAQNGEATIVAENDGRFSTAVSPCPIGNITIPATLAGAKVTHIGRDAFRDCSALTTVTIPEGVVRIGRDAFRDCTGLKSIKIPSSVKIIERDAFAGCNALSSVSIPEGVTIIDRGTFVWCCGLESIEIPPSVMRIGRDAFFYCLGLTSVTIPENVVDIGPQAFRRCNALTSVTLPASVTNINDTAFFDTGALTSFQVDPGNRFYKSENGLLLTKDGTMLVRGVNGDAAIPSSVTAIGSCAFEGCVALRSAVIPPGVKSIGNFAFKQCRGMKSVTIPESVTDIGQEAFWGCKNLKSIAIPLGVTVIRNATFSRSGLTEAVIPSNVKVLERDAISWCGELRSVTFPEGMISIGRYAICNCGKLVSLTIPSSVRRIEQGAFQGCGSLTSVTMRGERPDAPNNIFDERCGKLKSIHVPANAKSWAGMKDWQGIPLVFDAAESNVASSSMEDRSSVASILKGMIKVPGRDYWLSETELTQGQWESIMGYNLSNHRGANLPVENVSRDDCDVFLEKLNQTEEVKSSQFEFRLPELEEWKYAAWAGSAGHGSWIKPGIVGDVLDMAWVEANSSNQTHAVATKAPNAFGFYDMLGNVWEWLSRAGGDAPGGCGSLKGCAFTQVADKCTWNQNWHIPTTRRHNCVGLRLAANIKPQRGLLGRGLLGRGLLRRRPLRPQEVAPQRETVDGYTWSYRVENSEATIVAEKGGKFSCAVSPTPTGDISIPATLGGVKVTRIGRDAFAYCAGLKSATIPSSVRNIDSGAFANCGNLQSIVIPEGVESIKSGAFSWYCGVETVSISSTVTNIEQGAFCDCTKLRSFHVDPANPCYRSINGLLCSKDGSYMVAGVNGDVMIPEGVATIGSDSFHGCFGLNSVLIPSSVTNIEHWALSFLPGLSSVRVDAANPAYKSVDGLLLTKDGRKLVRGVNGKVTIPDGVECIIDAAFSCSRVDSLAIPEGVTNIEHAAFYRCSGMQTVTIPSSVKNIGGAFGRCYDLTSVTMLGERPNAPNNIFDRCGKLKAIHVPANAKSWAGMKDWFGIPLVFDAE